MLAGSSFCGMAMSFRTPPTFARRYKRYKPEWRKKRQVKAIRQSRNPWKNRDNRAEPSSMVSRVTRMLPALFALAAFALPVKFAQAQRLVPTYFPEQRTIRVRDPSQLARYNLPELPPPPTVTNRLQDLEPQ